MILRHQKTALFSLYFIYLLDLMGVVMVYVLFSPLIIDSKYSMVPSSMDSTTRNTLLGILFAMYPVAQFFSAPVLGDISDRIGRLKVLSITTLLTAVFTATTALAIHIDSIALLFISRLFSGLCAGNLTVTQATVSSISPDDKVARNMGLFALVGGIGWTIGPLLANVLSTSSIEPFFNIAFPFWFVSGLLLLCYVLIIVSCNDIQTNKTVLSSFSLTAIIKNLYSALKSKSIIHIFSCSVITMVGWMMYQSFLAPYLIEKYSFSKDLEGYAYAISSIFWFLGASIATYILSRKTSPKKLLNLPLFLSGCAIIMYSFSYNPIWVWPLMAIANLTQAIATSCFYALFAQNAAKSDQGKIFGAWNAGFALSSTIGPIAAGILVNIQINLPYIISALIIIGASYYFQTVARKTCKI